MANVESVCSTQITYSVTNSVLDAVADGILVKTFVEHQEYYRCIVCNRSMSGIVPAQSHLEGSPHRKAIRTHMYSSVLGTSMRGSNLAFDSLDSTSPSHCSPATSYQSPALVQEQNTSVSSIKPLSQNENDVIGAAMKCGIVGVRMENGQTLLFCHLCNIPCTGEASMTQHLEGEPHCKKQRMEFPKDQATAIARPSKSPASLHCSTSPSLLSSSYNPERGLDLQKHESSPTRDMLESAVEDGIVTKTEGITSFWTCTICKTSCTGDTPMKQHLQGSSHQKKMRNGYHRRIEDLPSYPCNTSQEKIALKSPKSQDNTLPSRDILDSALENGIVVPDEFDQNHLTCTICGSSCTGETPMRQHLKGSSHLRKIRARGYAHLSTACVTPTKILANVFEKKDCTSLVQSSDASRDLLESAIDGGCVEKIIDGYQCLICSISCNSVISISDHLAGDQHHRKQRDQKNFAHLKASSDQMRGKASVSPPGSQARSSSSTAAGSAQVAFKSDVNNVSISGHLTGGSFKNIDNLCNSFYELPETLRDIKVYLADNTLDDLFS